MIGPQPGRPACGPVPMPERLVLPGLCSRSAAAAGLQRRDRLPFLRVYGSCPADRMPHAPTIRRLAEPLARAAGWSHSQIRRCLRLAIAPWGQVTDATVAAPRRKLGDEKATVRGGV
ncbi:hypothetical protein SH611_06025 [Geminicoccaceae bacterium 1502E]|nr:hypothetical protein [Geminicoccaceae bacterium 1502E]